MIPSIFLTIIPLLIALIFPAVPFIIGLFTNDTNNKVDYYAIALWIEIIVIVGYYNA